MAYTFLDLQSEVKARAIKDQSGTSFDTRIKNTINTSLFRIARESKWRMLRRKSTFDTVEEYNEGTGAVAVTDGSKSVTVTGATFLTDGVNIGRRVKLGGSSLNYVIKTITGETTFTVDTNYDGTTSTAQSYSIYGQEEYNLALQTAKIDFVWHEDYGYPYIMRYYPDDEFYSLNRSVKEEGTPTSYRQSSANGVVAQLKKAGVLSIVSSSASDTSGSVTIYGTVSNYPDYESISLNGTTTVNGSKSFDAGSIEMVTKDTSTVGRVTVTGDSANTTVSVLPVGDRIGQVQYFKIQLFPFPSRVFPVHFGYYKMPSRMVNNGDMHELGQEFDESIILLTVSKVNYSEDKKSGDKFFGLYKDEIKSLRKQNSDTVLDWFPQLRRAKRFGSSLSPHRYLSHSQLVSTYYGPII